MRSRLWQTEAARTTQHRFRRGSSRLPRPGSSRLVEAGSSGPCEAPATIHVHKLDKIRTDKSVEIYTYTWVKIWCTYIYTYTPPASTCTYTWCIYVYMSLTPHGVDHDYWQRADGRMTVSNWKEPRHENATTNRNKKTQRRKRRCSIIRVVLIMPRQLHKQTNKSCNGTKLKHGLIRKKELVHPIAHKTAMGMPRFSKLEMQESWNHEENKHTWIQAM